MAGGGTVLTPEKDCHSQGEGYLNFLLSKEVGTVAMDEIDALVNRLVERTDGLAVKYSNLWKGK